jgi:ketosteroid isomerase-like protein
MEAGPGTIGTGATPEGVSREFAAGVAARDPEAAVAFLATDGCLLTADGTEVRGKAQAREVLAQIVMTHPLIRIATGRMLIAGEVAVVSQRWTIGSKGSGEGLFERSFAAVLVLSREEEGWRVAVAAPWGCDQLDLP